MKYHINLFLFIFLPMGLGVTSIANAGFINPATSPREKIFEGSFRNYYIQNNAFKYKLLGDQSDQTVARSIARVKMLKSAQDDYLSNPVNLMAQIDLDIQRVILLQAINFSSTANQKSAEKYGAMTSILHRYAKKEFEIFSRLNKSSKSMSQCGESESRKLLENLMLNTMEMLTELCLNGYSYANGGPHNSNVDCYDMYSTNSPVFSPRPITNEDESLLDDNERASASDAQEVLRRIVVTRLNGNYEQNNYYPTSSKARSINAVLKDLSQQRGAFDCMLRKLNAGEYQSVSACRK